MIYVIRHEKNLQSLPWWKTVFLFFWVFARFGGPRSRVPLLLVWLRTRLPILCLGLLCVQMALRPCLHQAIWSHGWNMAPGFPGILSVGGVPPTFILEDAVGIVFRAHGPFKLILLTLLLVKIQKSENCHCESLRNLSFSLESFANLRILPLHPTAFQWPKTKRF